MAPLPPGDRAVGRGRDGRRAGRRDSPRAPRGARRERRQRGRLAAPGLRPPMPESATKILVADDDQSLVRTLEWMPKVDGLQVLAKMKADERFRDLPVLMISSMPPEEATVRSLGLGAADFIAKPFRVRELLARVEAHIRQARELAHAREEAQNRAAIVDILHEVTDSLKPDEIYHILVRR